MRSIINFILLLTGMTVFLTSCDKVDDLPVYGNGKTSVLTASTTTVAPAAADSMKTALTLKWTYPGYATDSSNIKYRIEFDATGNNFANPYVKEILGKDSVAIIARELNNMLLARGYAFNIPVDMDVRLITSYANNNERITANTIKIKMTPYKVPPKVALPASGKLFLVGGATVGGWSNPVPAPSQELARLDETTFGGVFQLKGGESYLILPVNGSWDAKYGFDGANNGNKVEGDNFKAGGGDLKAPAADGLYTIIVDFQAGKFTVTPFTGAHGLPSDLYIVGGATPGGWSNPVPTPSQHLTRLNASQFTVTLALTSGEKFLLLPTNGDWGKKFGLDGAAGTNNLTGKFKPEGADIPAPTTSGNYKITFDFVTSTYTMVKI
ncbi:SusE domain-containing protein [Flavisolibacter tropicus]|uniref:SusE outer membrane protein domain-containing protein n=1 Tax=Flavisolibacter tropicus TaxID=1492898 RepID=A0A172TYG2_9BACT|nr:SusE domain-containing protein [Flavisolibacter tropicus]ANE52080.1 hypothetical protein SY85_17855 [Flavisolibacter tropicus]